MDRYNEEEMANKLSRSNRNKDLYQNIGTNTRYTNFTDVANTNAIELGNIDRTSRTRENYQKMREYSNLIPGPKVKRELDEFKNIYKEKENRIYDINSVMAEARKNRTQDEVDSKRKLKNDKYNILLSMTKEELEEYRKERKEKFTHPDEDELHELIDTIASKTLAGEIDKITSVNLLSELMATSIMDKVEKPIQEKTEENREEDDISEEIEEDLKITTPVKMDYGNKDISEEKESVEEENSEAEVKDEDSDEEKIKDDNQDKSFITGGEIDINEINKLKEELDAKDNPNNQINGVGKKDNDFYTDNDGLSGEDFEEEMDDGFKENKMPLPLKVFIILIVLAVIAVAAYYIYQMIL